MPIEKQLKYENEADFISRFLVPLLRRLGFSIVAEYHGAQEFGKDLVFGEIDRFANVSYHGLQAKYVDGISQSDSHGLIQDCREAFGNPFRHPNTGTEQHISTFLVANAGSIALNARTNFFNTLNTPHGGHIRMLDGKALLDLDRWATANRVEFIREYLSGLLLEVRYNSSLIAWIRDMVQKRIHVLVGPVPIERLRVVAIESYLTRPFMSSHIDIDVVSNYWEKVANGLNPRLDHLAPNRSDDYQRRLAQEIIRLADEIASLGQGLELAISTILTQLGPLTGV